MDEQRCEDDSGNKLTYRHPQGPCRVPIHHLDGPNDNEESKQDVRHHGHRSPPLHHDSIVGGELQGRGARQVEQRRDRTREMLEGRDDPINEALQWIEGGNHVFFSFLQFSCLALGMCIHTSLSSITSDLGLQAERGEDADRLLAETNQNTTGKKTGKWKRESWNKAETGMLP